MGRRGPAQGEAGEGIAGVWLGQSLGEELWDREGDEISIRSFHFIPVTVGALEDF